MISNIEVFSDGGSRGNPGPAAAAIVVKNHNKVIYQEGRFIGKATNNVAEYTGALMVLEWLLKNKDAISESSVNFFMDSELVVKQLQGVYKAKSKLLLPFLMKIKNIEKELSFTVNYQHVRRDNNSEADQLLNEVLDENS